MTNETVFAFTYVGFPNVFADPAKVNRSNVGYNYKGLVQQRRGPDSFYGTLVRAKRRWSSIPVGLKMAVSGLVCRQVDAQHEDMLTKVKGDHTLKVGFFYEWIRNSQPANATPTAKAWCPRAILSATATSTPIC